MSKDNTEFDVRVAVYDCTHRAVTNIYFFNDCEHLLESKRVKIVREDNRLYFTKGDAVKGSIKLSGRDKNTLQLWSDYSKTRDLEGNYDLKYDNKMDMYYIDKDNKLSDARYKTSTKGIPQNNHNPQREKREGEHVMTVAIKPKAQKMIEKVNVQKNVNENALVVKALMQLLKTQVKGNAEALSTIEVVEKFI